MDARAIAVELSDDDLRRVDNWRHGDDPVVSRKEAIGHLVSIALDDAEMKSTGRVPIEVVDLVTLALSSAHKFETDATELGAQNLVTESRLLQETLHGLGLLLGISAEQLSSVLERLDALREAPDKKN